MTAAGECRDQVRIGTAGWSYPDWNGKVYSSGDGPAGRGLGLLSRFFPMVEVNSTYYRSPAAELARGWLRKVHHNPTFLFTAKLWKGFTHDRDFRQSDVVAFRAGIEPLHEAGRFGALLIQYPWSFRYDDGSWRYLSRVVDAFAGLPLVVEVRHESWDCDAALGRLRDRGVGFCNIDQPIFPGSLPATAHVTSEVGYVRLHGRNAAAWFDREAGRDRRYNYLYSIGELEPWVERIRRTAAGARRVFVVTNNHFAGSAVVNALELQHLLGGERRALPDHWLDSFPRLGPLSSRSHPVQGTLFR